MNESKDAMGGLPSRPVQLYNKVQPYPFLLITKSFIFSSSFHVIGCISDRKNSDLHPKSPWFQLDRVVLSIVQGIQEAENGGSKLETNLDNIVRPPSPEATNQLKNNSNKTVPLKQTICLYLPVHAERSP
jgi:hypothetical protein